MAAKGAVSIDPLIGEPYLRKVRDLGAGSFGYVGLYQRQGFGVPNEEVALKCLPVRVVDYTMIKREVRSHCSLNHRKLATVRVANL